MAVRRPSRPKQKISIPASVRDVPASRAMLSAVRDELIERMSAMDARWESRFIGLEKRFIGLEKRFDGLAAQFEELRHDVRADVARVVVLVEEQNARNAIVLEALRAVIDRQTRAEQRIDGIEASVRSLAAPR